MSSSSVLRPRPVQPQRTTSLDKMLKYRSDKIEEHKTVFPGCEKIESKVVDRQLKKILKVQRDAAAAIAAATTNAAAIAATTNANATIRKTVEVLNPAVTARVFIKLLTSKDVSHTLVFELFNTLTLIYKANILSHCSLLTHIFPVIAENDDPSLKTLRPILQYMLSYVRRVGGKTTTADYLIKEVVEIYKRYKEEYKRQIQKILFSVNPQIAGKIVEASYNKLGLEEAFSLLYEDTDTFSQYIDPILESIPNETIRSILQDARPVASSSTYGAINFSRQGYSSAAAAAHIIPSSNNSQKATSSKVNSISKKMIIVALVVFFIILITALYLFFK